MPHALHHSAHYRRGDGDLTPPSPRVVWLVVGLFLLSIAAALAVYLQRIWTG